MTSFTDNIGWDQLIPYIQMEEMNRFTIVGTGVEITDAELDALRAARLSDEQLKQIFEQAHRDSLKGEQCGSRT